MKPIQCECCGKFRKKCEVVLVGGEGEDWIECRYCMSEHDSELFFKDEKEKGVVG